MGSVKSIEQAVEALPADQLAEFRQWFAAFDSAAWDRQLARDASTGALDALLDEALTDHRTGPSRAL